MNKGRIG